MQGRRKDHRKSIAGSLRRGSLWLSKGFSRRRNKRPRARNKNGAQGRTGAQNRHDLHGGTAAADVKRGKAAGSAGRI